MNHTLIVLLVVVISDMLSNARAEDSVPESPLIKIQPKRTIPVPPLLKPVIQVKAPDGAQIIVRDRLFKTQNGTCDVVGIELPKPADPPFVHIRVEFSADGKNYVESRRVRLREGGKLVELDYSDIVKPDKKKRTYAYWCEMGEILELHAGGKGKDTPHREMALAVRAIASDVSNLPTRGVDEEAVNCAHTLIEEYERLAKYLQKQSAIGFAGMLVESIIRGAAGDPAGTARELLDEEKAVLAGKDKLLTQLRKARTNLTAKYDIEFP